MNIFLLILAIFEITVAQNASQNGGKSYFFKMGKNSNEFRVNNRIMYLNHNITDLELPIVESRRKVYPTVERQPKLDFSMYLDEEWNYDHSININKSQLPLFVNKFYEEITASPEIGVTTRILFNTNINTTSPILKFNMDNLDQDEIILEAELYFYWPLKNDSKLFRESVVLKLYQFEGEDDNDTDWTRNIDVHKLFNVIYVSKAHKGWQMFKIKKSINNWLDGEENKGVFLTVSTYDSNELIEVFNDTNSGNFSTFIIVKSQKNETFSESNEIVSPGEDIHPHCQRQTWTINFNKMGWDKFIISPKEFTAYDCAGKCYKSIENDLNHVKFLHMFQKRTPCCVPTRYLPLTIMFYDKFGDIAIKSYDRTIVDNCGCK